MSTRTSEPATAEQILARLEQLPVSSRHLRIRLFVGSATFFDGMDALAIAYILPVLVGAWDIYRKSTQHEELWRPSVASAWLRVASIAAPLFIGFTIAMYQLGAIFLALGVMAWLGVMITGLFSMETKDRVLEEISP